MTAQKIVDYRTQHGPFTSVDDLDAIPGIGPARIDNLRGLVIAVSVPAPHPLTSSRRRLPPGSRSPTSGGSHAVALALSALAGARAIVVVDSPSARARRARG